MRINQRYAPKTVSETLIRVRKFLRKSKIVSYESISLYLKDYLNHAPSTYNNELKALRRFVTYIQLPELLNTFKAAPVDYLSTIIEPPTRQQVRSGFEAQDNALFQAIYLFIASTGLRKSELLSLSIDNINWDTRCIKCNHYTRTKRSGITFFNEEAANCLRQYLSGREDNDSRLFVISSNRWREIWNKASDAAGIRITAKCLRLWHSTELGELAVPDRYVDIFQGRAPRSVLAKHYTGSGLERLKRIYDKASLRVLS